MTMRRMNYAERIHELEREMETRQIFLQAAVDELTELKQKDDAGKTTYKDQLRAVELDAIMVGHKTWIDQHKDEIKAFYRPAIA